MDEVKLLRKYIQDKTMHYKYFKKVSLEDAKNAHLTDYEKGYIAGVCHAFNEVNRDLNSDNIDAEVIINKRLGRGLGWCRVKDE